MKTFGRIVGITLSIAVAALLALSIALFTGVLPRQAFLVESDSMTPAIPVGALIVVDTDAPVEVGDAISFSLGDDVVTHRLLEITAEGDIITQGDAMAQVDPFGATTDDVIGPVTTVIPGAAAVLGFLTSPAGMLSIAMVVLGGTALLLLTGRDEDEEQDETTIEAQDKDLATV